jgi:hypothetical protein
MPIASNGFEKNGTDVVVAGFEELFHICNFKENPGNK